LITNNLYGNLLAVHQDLILAKIRGRIKVRKTMIVVVISCLALISVACAYIFSVQFRQGIDMVFNNQAQHGYRIENVEYKIPLPPKTIFAYRTSETQAKYITKTAKDDIIKFYGDLSGTNSNVNSWQKGDFTVFSFSYNQRNFVIELKQSSSSNKWDLLIDIE
jgi:hypothetical protein